MQNQTTIKDRFPEVYTKLLLAKSADSIADMKLAEYRNLMRDAMFDLRNRIGITAKAFGGLIGVSKGYVYLLEKGDRPWSPKLLEKLNEKLAEFPNS
jgi:hypothetical protein